MRYNIKRNKNVFKRKSDYPEIQRHNHSTQEMKTQFNKITTNTNDKPVFTKSI